MGLVFFCQGCGSRFDVPESRAGHPASCARCGRRTVIPGPVEPVSAVSASEPFTDVGLKPLTVDSLPVLPRLPLQLDPLADVPDDDEKPYTFATAEMVPPVVAQLSSPVPAGKVAWRRALGALQKPFRWLNDAAYLVSVPFLMLILVGTIARSRPMAVLGAAAVVLLNAGRLATGLVNLVLIPFREGIGSGLLFLVPLVTPIYLVRHWGRMRAATRRVVEPIATVGLVVVAFTFVPWLRRGGADRAPGGLVTQLRAGAEGLEADVREEVEKVESGGLRALDPRASPAVPVEPPVRRRRP